MEISGHENSVIVGLSGNINCSTHLNVSQLEWYIKGFDDPVESATGVNSLPLTLNPEGTALNGTSVICKATTTGGKVYEQTVVILVKGMNVCTNLVAKHIATMPLIINSSFVSPPWAHHEWEMGWGGMHSID